MSAGRLNVGWVASVVLLSIAEPVASIPQLPGMEVEGAGAARRLGTSTTKARTHPTQSRTHYKQPFRRGRFSAHTCTGSAKSLRTHAHTNRGKPKRNTSMFTGEAHMHAMQHPH